MHPIRFSLLRLAGQAALAALLFLLGCGRPPIPASGQAAAATPASTPASTPAPGHSPTALPSPTLTPAAEISPTAAPTATPVWVTQGPGTIRCPILLYHRIAEPPPGPPLYFVRPEDFRDQMAALSGLGYTTITPVQLADAIQTGAPLPSRPIIITFDDGDISVYQTAFPILQSFGLTGTVYLVDSYLGAEGYMDAAQIQALAAAGWSVGSHSLSHANLAQSSEQAWQLSESRRRLEETLGLPVETFAYPFGAVNEQILIKTSRYYRAGMGLGLPAEQGPANLFYLNRQEVRWEDGLDGFLHLLPWIEPLP